MIARRFIQCDVFSETPLLGNGLAVVVDGEGLTSEAMQAFAAWTNLAESTFLLPPTRPDADYRVRIFSPKMEMPFAGHPTLGSCAAWLHCGGTPATAGIVRQECAIGVVEIDIGASWPAFAAPPTTIEPLEPEARGALLARLDIPESRVRRSARLSNGPSFTILELAHARDVLAVDATRVGLPEYRGVGLLGACDPGHAYAYELRNIAPSSGMVEDPITGSMQAAVAQWMVSEGRWREPVLVAQGTAMGRDGRVRVTPKADGVWIAGKVSILIDGVATL